MKIQWVVFLVLTVSLSAHAKQQGTFNVSNEKMCVCDPCGGKMVPCNESKNEYISPETKPQSGAAETAKSAKE